MATSKTKKSERDFYGTPVPVFNRIQEVANMVFAHDVCATAKTTKCPCWWSKRENALKIKWHDIFDPMTPLWMNPPYSDLTIWTAKAAQEAAAGMIIMGLLPDIRSSAWYRNNVKGVANTVFEPDGRIDFLLPDGRTIKRGNDRPSIFVLWTPWQTGQTQFVTFTRKPKRICPHCHTDKNQVLDQQTETFNGDVVECLTCRAHVPAEHWKVK